MFLTSSQMVLKLFVCGPHFDVDIDTEQFLLGAGGQKCLALWAPDWFPMESNIKIHEPRHLNLL